MSGVEGFGTDAWVPFVGPPRFRHVRPLPNPEPEQLSAFEQKLEVEALKHAQPLFEKTPRPTVAKAFLKFSGVALAFATLAATDGYVQDDVEVQQMLEHTHPYIIENSAMPAATSKPLIPMGAYEAMDESEKSMVENLSRPDRLAMVNMPGFGMLDTYHANEVFSPFKKIGATWSIHYDNTGIDTTVIAKQIIDKAHAENINEIGLYGDSMGTIIESKVAVEIARLAPDLTIPFVVMDSPAVGLKALRPKSISDGYTLLHNIHLPGVEYSRYARMAAEVYLRLGQIHNLDSLVATLEDAHQQVFDNRDLPANTLLAEQFQMIVSSDVKGDLKYLGSLPADKRPVIVFMGAANPARDDVVNTPKSLAMVQKWTDEAGLQLLGPYGIEDFYHGAQWRSEPEYKKVLGTQVVPSIVSAMGESALTTNVHLPFYTGE